LGTRTSELLEASTWKNVELRNFNFSQYPPHFRNLRNFAWKPVILKDALYKDGYWILYQDAGQEFRKTIREVEKLIERDGYMFVAQDGWETQLKCCGRIGELTVPALYEILGVRKEDYENKNMCAGGIQGYRIDSPAVEKVLEFAVDCAMNPECIEPMGAHPSVHRYDQSVFSILVNKNGFVIQNDSKYWGNRGNKRSIQFPQTITKNPRHSNDIIFFSRRGWGIDYELETSYELYTKFIIKKKN